VVTRARHSDTQLIELAAEGSAPAFASLLHRYRGELQRVVLDAADPRRATEATMVAAIRDLRRRRLSPDTDVRSWVRDLARAQVVQDPSPADVDQLLPTDWFDRAWSAAERAWPSGRALPRPPRWATLLLGAVALAATSSLATYLYLSYEATTVLVGELVAEPIEPGTGLVPTGSVTPAEPGDELLPAPELFGDIEIGELPTYDLTGRGDGRPTTPEIGPPPAATSDDAATSTGDGATGGDGSAGN
jgi:hypothetical protein